MGSEKTPIRLIELVSELIKVNPAQVRICVSSRPWIDFETVFGSGPHLRLEHLMHRDIKHYISSKFGKDASFQQLDKQEPELADELMESIV
jgi:hypothetical protein